MKTGIQYQENMQIEDIKTAGFSWLEVDYSQRESLGQKDMKLSVSGIIIKAEDFVNGKFSELSEFAEALKAYYFVVDMRNFTDSERVDSFVEQNRELIQQSMLQIYFESGYIFSGGRAYQCYNYSEISWLKKKAEKYNQLCGTEKFGLCLNVGYANLLGKNLRTFVEEAGSLLKLVHMNDNDGLHDDQQVPMTFTKGRGTRTTDIFRLIGTLVKTGYKGWMIFDTKGLFTRSPVYLHRSFMQLMQSLVREWENQFALEQKLDQPGKKLILFGTGKMAQNYMSVWGGKYPPAFMVDNNSDLWEQERYGIRIRKPEDILEVPEAERNVFICNRFYGAVGNQLSQMGIEYQYYDDNYFM